ncbi:class E sortase [Citricoccus sp. SGAir0253]|nr:class E sortase [Citricoccus sp. SGAir0253]
MRAPGAEEAIRAEAPGATAEAAPETGTGNGAGSGTVQGPGAEQAARDGGVPQAAGPALDSGVWGILYVPRFGPDYAKPIAEGVDPDVLDSVGIGHYPGTQRPGQLGNVGLAGHRQTHGGVFWHMDRLGPGDRAYLQTREGVYTYVYRSTEIVPPSGIQVLYPVPGDSGAVPTRRLLTLTTCHPPFTTDLRMVVHLEQGSFVPAGTTAPPEVRDVVRRAAGLEGA